ncbi:MAG: TetR/AcrR family transcriptional regulator [Gammaproteobacteria bacterium]
MARNPTKRGTTERSAQTRRRIIDVAIDVFAEHGYRGAFTREIARRAGIHHPLIVYHFKDKLGLWRECAHTIQQDMATQVRQLLQRTAGTDARNRLASFLTQLVENGARHTTRHRFMMWYLLDRPQVDPASARSALMGEGSDAWIGEVIAAQAAGVLPRTIDPVLLQYVLIGMATRLFMDPDGYFSRSGRTVTDPKVIAEQRDTILTLLGLHPRRKRAKR